MTITDEMIEAAKAKLSHIRYGLSDDELRAALTAALAAAPEEKVTNGWRLVPIAPTEEMIDCGWSSSTVTSARDAEKIYRAMVAAAPTTPVPQGGEKGEPVAIDPISLGYQDLFNAIGSAVTIQPDGRSIGISVNVFRKTLRSMSPDAPAQNETLEEGWQPIETAPKDEDRLMLGIVRNGKLEEIHIGGFSWAYNEDDVSCWWSEQGDDEIVPTHWMPLRAIRALPTPADGGKG